MCREEADQSRVQPSDVTLPRTSHRTCNWSTFFPMRRSANRSFFFYPIYVIGEEWVISVISPIVNIHDLINGTLSPFNWKTTFAYFTYIDIFINYVTIFILLDTCLRITLPTSYFLGPERKGCHKGHSTISHKSEIINWPITDKCEKNTWSWSINFASNFWFMTYGLL